MSAWGVIVAAGRGERAGLGKNKVFYEIDGRSVLSRCLDAFEASGLMDGLVLVLSGTDRQMYDALCEREGVCALVRQVVPGGVSRRESVYNGLKALPADTEIVAVHDAARPFVSQPVIAATVEAARTYGSGVISTRVVDTIKQIAPDGTVTTPDRGSLRAVQTPQTFNYKKLLAAHEHAAADGLEVTDDAMLFEHYYGAVHLVTADGAEENRKLTTRADFEALEHADTSLLRIGHGYDAHRFKAGRRLVLCGVEIPHDRGLNGHSDADVAVHALMDALLGAMGEGDIGYHFPDRNPKYKDISSMELLGRVMEIVRNRGYRVVNADITIVAQKPKISMFTILMRDVLARAMGISMMAVNVKATTTERMGFEGREEGISAHAVCLLEKHN